MDRISLKDLGNNIKYLRKMKGVTQSAAAMDLELSLTSYAKMERGETNISFTRLQQLADYLNINIADLISKKIDLQFREQEVEYSSPFKRLEEEVALLRKEMEEIKLKVIEE